MICPELERIPEFVLKNGRKILSEDTVNELTILISKLSKVYGNQKADALSAIGVLYGYMNEYELAKDSFYTSFTLQHSEINYANYIQTLERLPNPELAISESINFLKYNQNNFHIFKLLCELSYRYPSYEVIEELENLISFVYFENLEEKDYFYEQISDIQNTLKILDELSIDKKYFTTLISIAYSQIKRLQVGRLNFKYSPSDSNNLIVQIEVVGLEYIDIVNLNDIFDTVVFEKIEKEILSKDLYFDHLDKLSIGFIAKPIIREEV